MSETKAATNLKDGDYILSDNAAWIEVGQYAIRVRMDSEDECLWVDVYQSGKECEDALDRIRVTQDQLSSSIALSDLKELGGAL